MNKLLINNSISDNIFETPEKYLLCVGVPIARTGIQQYTIGEDLTDIDGEPLPTKDGIIDVYKDEKVLFDPKTIASFEGKPVTIGHVMIDAENWRDRAVGIAQNVRRGTGNNTDKLVADLLITDKDGINTIKSNTMREISLGYEAGYISDGIGKAHQVSITGNHIAIVPEGKAGHECRIYDEKTKEGKLMTLAEKLKKMLSLTVDEAVKESVEAGAASDNGDAGTGDACGTKDQPAPEGTKEGAAPVGTGDQPPADQQVDKLDMLNAKLDKLIDLLSAAVVVDEKSAEPAPEQPKDEPEITDETLVNLDADKPILVE